MSGKPLLVYFHGHIQYISYFHKAKSSITGSWKVVRHISLTDLHRQTQAINNK